jgi:hypothetical protein
MPIVRPMPDARLPFCKLANLDRLPFRRFRLTNLITEQMTSILTLAHLGLLLSGPLLPQNPVVRFDKYQAELRLPSEGLFAGEETDVEFRIVDTTQKDPVEEGFKGVGAIDASATLTMPSMPGMPEAKPTVHREGVPGDYGIVLFFAHGGEFQIDLNLKFPNRETHKVSFKVNVQDERPAKIKQKAPYRLQVVDWPKTAKAGQALPLKLRVVDTKTGKVQIQFDTAHTQKFHLLLASKDLNWFSHEHPNMKSDGTWVLPKAFPAGGEYWVYGDVAPSGKGSQILIAKVKVNGPNPKWNTKIEMSNASVFGQIKAVLSSQSTTIPVGRMTTLRMKLFDKKTGAPVGDTTPWLGAAGHLMIFRQDGQTVVHSHPREEADNQALVKQGIIYFNARFPKPGIYKVYAQVQWQGKVHTFGFGIRVKE